MIKVVDPQGALICSTYCCLWLEAGAGFSVRIRFTEQFMLRGICPACLQQRYFLGNWDSVTPASADTIRLGGKLLSSQVLTLSLLSTQGLPHPDLLLICCRERSVPQGWLVNSYIAPYPSLPISPTFRASTRGSLPNLVKFILVSRVIRKDPL